MTCRSCSNVRQCFIGDRFFEYGQDDLPPIIKGSTDDHHLGIEDVHQVCYTRSQIFTNLFHRRATKLITLQGTIHNLIESQLIQVAIGILGQCMLGVSFN